MELCKDNGDYVYVKVGERHLLLADAEVDILFGSQTGDAPELYSTYTDELGADFIVRDIKDKKDDAGVKEILIDILP